MHKNADQKGPHHAESIAPQGPQGSGASLGPGIRVAVVGARGYSGLDLVRILSRHPDVSGIDCIAHDATFAIQNYLPEFSSQSSRSKIRVIQESEWDSAQTQVLFLATPAEVSAEWAPRALERGVRVIDLSGAFRLKQDFKKWYGFEHPAPEWVEKSVYGLSPWISSQDAKLVANPGCYATSILMALLPVVRSGVADAASWTIDAKSGVSGAGRKLAETYLFNELDGECLPYRVGKHQHTPEIQQAISQLTDWSHPSFSFATHLLPVRRGIISSLYARVADSKKSSDEVLNQLDQAFSQAYKNYPLAKFGRMSGKNLNSESGIEPNLGLSLKRVVGSARVQIQYDVVDGRIYLFSLIDNLLKGAASQAVENFNLGLGRPAEFCLEEIEGVL